MEHRLYAESGVMMTYSERPDAGPLDRRALIVSVCHLDRQCRLNAEIVHDPWNLKNQRPVFKS